MNDDFFKYLDQLELLGFFSGYPLLYAFITSLFVHKKIGIEKIRIVSLLPLAYAFTGTLYLGLQLKNVYPDFSFSNIQATIQPLKLVALISVLFWFPLLSKRPVISLLHSLIFFFFLAKDLFVHTVKNQPGDGRMQNNMKVFTDSLLLNIISLITVVLFTYFILFIKRRRKKI